MVWVKFEVFVVFQYEKIMLQNEKILGGNTKDFILIVRLNKNPGLFNNPGLCIGP